MAVFTTVVERKSGVDGGEPQKGLLPSARTHALGSSRGAQWLETKYGLFFMFSFSFFSSEGEER